MITNDSTTKIDLSNTNWGITYDTSADWTVTYPNTFPSTYPNSGLTLKDGRDLSDVLSNIEERLAILVPNVDLESRWDELKRLREQYQALEKEIQEMEKPWGILNK